MGAAGREDSEQRGESEENETERKHSYVSVTKQVTTMAF